MESSKSWLSMAAPTGWADVLFRTLMTGVVVFVVMQMKEYFDAGRLDTPGTAADAGLIAVGILLINAILMKVKS